MKYTKHLLTEVTKKVNNARFLVDLVAVDKVLHEAVMELADIIAGIEVVDEPTTECDEYDGF